MEILGLVDIPLSIILAVGIVTLLYIFLTWTHDYFSKRGIPGPKPGLFIGNTSTGFVNSLHKWRLKYGNVYGIFMGREPIFVISDLDILKEVLVKSFNIFRNRKDIFAPLKPLDLSVFFLEDDAWKRVRNIMTPTFSGSKLRAMCPTISDCAGTLTENFSKTFNSAEPVNVKEYFGAYTMDVIARTSFSVKVDSQNDLNNPFVSHAKLILSPNLVNRLGLLLQFAFPFSGKIFRALNISSFPKEANTFFEKNIREMINQRREEGVTEKRTDFLQLLMDAEMTETENDDTQTNGNIPTQKTVRRLTTDEIIAQGTIFFIAGYDTTASTLTFASYALAINPDVQEKAYREIKDVLGDEEPSYDNIGKLKYLENVITETLRLYPSAVSINRKASETITLKGVTIPKGFSIFVPVFSIQRDPQHYKEPEEFKPERHDEKNNPLTFLTFGYGPRICIGMRLALVEVKIALIHVMKRIRFEKTPNTPAKLEFNDTNLLQAKEDIRLKIIPRDEC